MERRSDLLSLAFYSRRFRVLLGALFVGGGLLLFATTFIGEGRSIIVGDALETFEYARSLIVDGVFPAAMIRIPCGVPLIGAIGYVPAVLTARLLGNGLGDGAAIGLQIAYCAPLIALAFAAFVANRSMLLRLGVSEDVAGAAVLFWIVVTNVGFYVFKEPAMTESATYALLSLYYWALFHWFYSPPGAPASTTESSGWFWPAIATGVFLGLAGAVRQQNILHATSVPLLLWVGHGGRRLRILGVVAAASIVPFAIPWLVWYGTTGTFRLMSYTEGHFNWLSPQPLKVLFVPGYHGLFTFHPAVAVAAAGLVLFGRRARALVPVWSAAILVQLYLVSTWYWLSFGASIGHRGFMTCMPLLLIGFAVALERMRARFERSVVAGLFLLAAANAVVTVLVLRHVIDPSGGGYPPNSGF
jgi:hypothetical protein